MDKPISVLIVDDELHSRDYLSELIEQDSRFAIMEECAGGEDAIQSCMSLSPDVILLDIEMPKIGGFEVLQAISSSSQSPIIVIVSAFSHYAIKAFECEVFDYITKPISLERFTRAKDRVYRRFREKQSYSSLSSERLRGVDSTANKSIFDQPKKQVQSVSGPLFYRDQEIQYLESAGNYVKIRFKNETHLVRNTLMNFSQTLDSASFLRVHRSFVVNIQNIRKLANGSSGQIELLMDNGETVPVSRGRKNDVLATIGGEQTESDHSHWSI